MDDRDGGSRNYALVGRGILPTVCGSNCTQTIVLCASFVQCSPLTRRIRGVFSVGANMLGRNVQILSGTSAQLPTDALPTDAGKHFGTFLVKLEQ